MKEVNFNGLGTALTTPFYPNGNINFDSLKWLVKRQIDAGIDFLVPSGTTGETSTLSHDEHVAIVARVMEYMYEEGAKRVPVLAGTGSNSTEEAIKLTRAAKEYGADGALVVSPYYNKPTQKGIKLHYRVIAEIGLPVVLYDIPSRCGGSGVSAETILELAHEGTICGLKWASGNKNQLKKVLAERPENFVVFSGDDILTQYAMDQGADGVISVLSNLMPKKMVEYVTALKNKEDMWECCQLEAYLSAIMEAMFFETNPIPVKTAMALVWPEIFKETFRLPMCEMETENREKLIDVLKLYDLLK
jgi:4-hydroxy-tetrahydrodipicolinate synthase